MLSRCASRSATGRPDGRPVDADAAADDQALFLGQGPYLTLEGNWRVEGDSPPRECRRRQGVLRCPPRRRAGRQVSTVASAWDNPTPGLGWNELGGLVLLVIGFGFALWRGALGQAQPPLAGPRTAHDVRLRLRRAAAVRRPLAFVAGTLRRTPSSPTRTRFAPAGALRPELRQLPRPKRRPAQGLKLDPYPLDLTVQCLPAPGGPTLQLHRAWRSRLSHGGAGGRGKLQPTRSGTS